MLLGLTGTKGSGKGEVAEILKQKGFLYESLSDRVREEAIARGLKNFTVKDLQDIGDELREKFGNGVWAKRTLKKLQKQIQGNKNCVIDGIRNLGEIEELRKIKGFILIAVDAPQENRYKRLMNRKRASDPKTWEGFLEMDNRDRGLYNLNTGQQVDKCVEAADIKIVNDLSLEKLREKIEKSIKLLY